MKKHYDFSKGRVRQGPVKPRNKRISELEAELKARDETIHVLEDALVFLRDNRMHDSRVSSLCAEALARLAELRKGSEND